MERINLTIEPGEMIGLVGPSGAGKTTIVNLACRFYDVAEGAVLVDGTDVRSFPIEEYRRHIGLVLQEPFLFYGTIAENIAYGRFDARRDELIAAAKAARAHEFILRLPDGYDSLVGERGQSLSGGERQRISIARALLIDPRILILDEATSSVDTETEREIQLALDNLIRGRTTIAIAHRLSTLSRANRLIVMERGQIVEAGPQQELLDRDGLYARLYRAQLGAGSGERGAGSHPEGTRWGAGSKSPAPSSQLPSPISAPRSPLSAPRPPLRPLRLDHDPWGQLLMETDDGRKFSGVVPVRAFPVSDPDHWISICSARGRRSSASTTSTICRRTCEPRWNSSFPSASSCPSSAGFSRPRNTSPRTGSWRPTAAARHSNSTARTTCGGSSPTRPRSSMRTAFAI